MLTELLSAVFSNMLYFTLHLQNGSSFPKPLSAAEEKRCFEHMKIGDKEAAKELIEHNLRLVAHVTKKYYSLTADSDDLISIGTIGLIKAVNTFCPSRNIKLATYASRCIENEILMHLRKISNMRTEVSIDEPLNIDWDGNELLLSDILGSESDSINVDIEHEDEANTLLGIVNTLNEREQTIMRLRFGIGIEREYTQKEVADMLGISQSYISRLEKRIIEHIKKEMVLN